MLKRVDSKIDGTSQSRLRLPFLSGSGDAASRGPVIASQLSGQRFRRRLLVISFLLLVALPTVVTGIYYALIASDQYSAEARFSIKSASGQRGAELAPMFQMMQSGSSVSDAYIVMDFVRSRQILDKLAASVDYRGIFSRQGADFIARLDPSYATEDTVRYWRRMVTIGFDTTSQIITLTVRTFSPQDTLQLATAIIKQSEELINEMSSRARADAVKYAEQEVQRMELILRMARSAMQKFRETKQELDPRKKADARQQIIENLQGELTQARARLSGQRQQLSESAPSVIYQAGIIKSLEKQIEEERERIALVEKGGPDGKGTIGGLISDFEALASDREFAEKQYLAALSSLEQARFDAIRQQRYLATIVEPALPDDAQFPKRVLNTTIVFALAFCLWALMSLILLAVRDHVT